MDGLPGEGVEGRSDPRPDPRGHLAAVRSVLANERTFLAYQRTAVTTLAAAVSFIKFFDNPLLEILGWLLVPVSVITAGLGALRYRRMRGRIQRLEAQGADPNDL